MNLVLNRIFGFLFVTGAILGFAALGFTVGMLDGVVFRIGISILLGTVLKMDITGFWLGSVLAGYTYLFVGGAYFFSGKWRTRPLAVK